MYTCRGGKNNDEAKKNYFSCNKWDSAKDILEIEYRIDKLKVYARTKRKYTQVNKLKLINIIALTYTSWLLVIKMITTGKKEK